MMVVLLLLICTLVGYGSSYYVMPKVVTIVESPVDTLVCEGCSLELTCTIHYQTETAANLPQPIIKWMINNGTDSTLVSNSTQNSTGNFTISTLTVPNAQLEHQGSYRCVVVDGNDTNHCHSPRFQCVPLVTISREATVKVLDNSTINGRNSDHNSSSIPCNITSRKETVFIINSTNVLVNVTTESTNVIIESTNTTIELICPVDECINVSDVVWYHNGEEMSAGEVSGNPSQFYGVYQCFISFNEGHSVEASITRILPYGLTNPPSKPNISEIPRANEDIYLQAVKISWTAPRFIGNQNHENLQYQITTVKQSTDDDHRLSTNTEEVIFFRRNYQYYRFYITVFSSIGNVSENSNVTEYYEVQGHCITYRVRFPPVLNLSCNDGGFNLSWRDSPDNHEYYREYTFSRKYYSKSFCNFGSNTLTMPLSKSQNMGTIVKSNVYEVGTNCSFGVAATVRNNCNHSREYDPGTDNCYCYDPELIEYTWEHCQVNGSLQFENKTYFTQENESVIEICVVGKGYGFTADISTVNGTAKDGKDFSGIHQTLSFNINTRTQCVNIAIFNDEILEQDETFQVVLSDVSSSLVNIAANSALVEITDNDYVTVNVTVSSDVIAEGGPPLRVCVQLPPIEKNITLDVTVESITANIEKDVVPPQNQLIFTPTSSETQCVYITIIDDDLLETMESFIVVLNTSDTSRVLISEDHFEIHIEDNDNVTANVTVSSDVIAEGGPPLRVCVQLPPIEKNITLDVTVESITANIEKDVVPPQNQLIFTPTSSETQCVYITIIDDDLLETMESFIVVLNTSDTSRVLISEDHFEIHIEDNDNVTANVTVSSDVIAEGGPPLRVCVQLPPIEKNITLDVTVESITANIEEDVVPPQNQLIFTPTSSETQCINITIIDDDLLETMESFIVVLNTSDTNGVLISEDHFKIHIEDNDEVTVALNLPETNFASEEMNSPLLVCAEANESLGRSVTVEIVTIDNTASGGKDYSSINQTLSFDINTRTQCVNITIFNDEVLEEDEIFQVILSDVSSSQVNITAANSALVEITDNDNVTANVTVSSDVIAEGGPPLRVCVQLPPIEKNITLDVTVESITANIEEDVVPPQNQLIFTPTSFETQCINITIIDDDLLETMESFIVVLNTSDTNGVLIREDHFKIHIEDNDGHLLVAGLIGSSSAFLIFIVIIMVIIASTVVTVVSKKYDTKRTKHLYLNSNDFEDWDVSPVSPAEMKPTNIEDYDRDTLLNHLGTPRTSIVMDYRDTNIKSVIHDIVLDDQRHSVHEPSKVSETQLDPTIPQESNCESVKNEVLPVAMRETSGDSSTRTGSSSSQPYVYDSSENAICQCPYCVSQRSKESCDEQLQEESDLELQSELNSLEEQQLPKTSPIKYMNTLTINTDSEQSLKLGDVTSPSEHSVLLLDVFPSTTSKSETSHAPPFEKHRLEELIETTELAIKCLEMEDASPQVVDTSVGCGRASSDDLSS